MKRCSKCGETKPLNDFSGASRTKDRKQSYCRNCANAVRRAAHRANPEKHREHVRKWRRANLEQRRKADRRQRAANPEKYRGYQRKYRETHPERPQAFRKKRQAENHAHLITVFGPACRDCGWVLPMGVFEYHHLDPDTKTEILRIAGWNWERIKAYVVGKTVQLCPTCHRLRHLVDGATKMRRKKP